MNLSILAVLTTLVILGPALLAYILRRRNPAVPFWKAYRAMLPGFLACAVLKAAYQMTNWFPLEVGAPVAMVVGVLVAVRRLER